MSDATRARATAILGLGPTDPGSDAVSAFLAALPASGFVPSSDQVAAVNALAGTSVPHDLAECDSDLDRNAQVEEFACAFWSLAPAERRAKWHALRAVAGEGPAARLLALETGLDVPVRELYDPLMNDLAVILRELFVLPPRARSARRYAWLLANGANHAYYCDAASSLRRLHPDLAVLDPLLMSRVKTDFSVAAVVEGARAEPRVVPIEEMQLDAAKAAFRGPFGWPEENSPHHATAQPQTTRGATEEYRWVVWILIAIVVGLGKFAGTYKSITPRPDPARPSTVSKALVVSREKGEFKPDEVANFRRYEKSDTESKPDGYASWILWDKPDPVRTPFGLVPIGMSAVTISQQDVDECLRHEDRPWPVAPSQYPSWVAVGSPRTPGRYLYTPRNHRRARNHARRTSRRSRRVAERPVPGPRRRTACHRDGVEARVHAAHPSV